MKWTLEQDGKVLDTCGTGLEADNWFVTSFVSFDTTLAEVINVEVEAGYKLCLINGSIAVDVPCYSNYFEVHAYLEGYMTSHGNITSSFKPLYNITSNTLPTTNLTRTIQTFSFNSQNYSQGLTLAFRSRGACGSIFRIKMYYYYCEETINDGVKFGRIPSPAEGFKNITGNCSENAVPSNNVTSVNGYCYRNGTWGKLEHGNLKCFCVEGYGPNKTDGSCSSKFSYRDLPFSSY